MAQNILRVRWQDYRRNTAAKTRFKILSEGDSWFAFSLKTDALDGQVIRLSKTPVVSVDLSTPGNTAEDLFATPSHDLVYQLLETAADADRSFDLLLLSAGGNDLLGNLLGSYIIKQPTKQVDPSDWIDETVLTPLLANILKWYQQLVDHRDKKSPGTNVVLHSYDYPQKLGVERSTGGPWITPVLNKAQGLKNNLALQKLVIKEVIDRFFSRVLTPLAALPGISVVDLRGTLTTNGPWFDEIHPDGNGYEKLAKKYKPTLQSLFPAVF